MMQRIDNLIESGSALEKVHYGKIGERLVTTVFLTFAGPQYVSASIDDDTDEIVLTEKAPDLVAEDVSTVSPWRGVIGKPIYATWSMRNNNGHADSFQFDFRTVAKDEPRIIQLYCMASTIKVYILVQVN